MPNFKSDEHGVWLPTVLANAVLACYYGDGPRFNDRKVAPPIPEAAPPIRDPMQDPGSVTPVELHRSSPYKVQPKGFSLRRLHEQQPPAPE